MPGVPKLLATFSTSTAGGAFSECRACTRRSVLDARAGAREEWSAAATSSRVAAGARCGAGRESAAAGTTTRSTLLTLFWLGAPVSGASVGVLTSAGSATAIGARDVVATTSSRRADRAGAFSVGVGLVADVGAAVVSTAGVTVAGTGRLTFFGGCAAEPGTRGADAGGAVSACGTSTVSVFAGSPGVGREAGARSGRGRTVRISPVATIVSGVRGGIRTDAGGATVGEAALNARAVVAELALATVGASDVVCSTTEWAGIGADLTVSGGAATSVTVVAYAAGRDGASAIGGRRGASRSTLRCEP